MNQAWTQANPRLTHSLKIILLAVVYYLSGTLGLILMIAPENATPFFPATGVALAAILLWGYRVWPGVLLGALLLNIPNFNHWLHQDIWRTLFIATIITLASTGQALCGGYLAQRFNGYSNRLDSLRSSGAVILLGGCISCLITPTLAIATLWMFDSTTEPWQFYVFKWLVWWIGDSLGVILIAPPLLVLASDSNHTRKQLIVLSFLAAILLIVGFFKFLGSVHHTEVSQRFHEEANNRYQLINQQLETSQRLMHTLNGLYAGSDHVTPQEFSTFIRNSFKDYAATLALEWVPRVPRTELAAFEANMQQHIPNFFIKEHDKNGALVAAKARDFYYPIVYIEITKEYNNIIGFDVGSETSRHQALLEAQNSGQQTSTQKIMLLNGKNGVLIFDPIFKNNKPHQTIAERQKNLNGFIVSVLDVNKLVNPKERTYQNTLLTIEDTKARPFNKIIYTEPVLHSPLITWSTKLQFANRTWLLNFAAAMPLFTEYFLWKLTAGLLLGLFISILVSLFLLITTGQTDTIYRKVEEKTREIAESKELLQLFIRYTPTAVAMLDRNFCYLVTSDRWLADYHLDKHQIIGKSFYNFFPKIMQSSDWLAIFQKVLQGNVHFIDEYRWVKDDGKTEWLKFIIHPWKEKNNSIVGGIVIFTEIITEHKKVEIMKNEFVSIASHELRTPLTAIRGSIGLLLAKKDEQFNEQTKKLLTVANNNCDRLIRLISDILDVEKIESGKMKFNLEPVDMEKLMNEAVDVNYGFAKKFSVDLNIQPSNDHMMVYADYDKLLQVLTNLISNAVKFSPSGETVSLSATMHDHSVRVFVKDKGHGIPKEFQERIFQKFAQDDTLANARGGSGLGLNISKSIIESLHGSIGFTTQAEKGTVFYFDLPLWTDPKHSPQ